VTSGTNESSALDTNERAELEELRAEVARLRADVEGEPPRPKPKGRGRRWGRNIVAILLIGIACLLAPLSVVAVWARGEVTDTDRYVNTVAPLASDPAIQDAVTTNLTNLVFQYIDVQGLATQAFSALAEKGSLPPALATQLQALAVPVANGVRSFAEDQISKLVQSSAFEQAWVEANRSAHQQLVAALSGKGGGAISVQGNTVQLNLAVFLNTVKNTLVDKGFQLASRIPTVNATFTIFQSKDVSKVQSAYNLLDKLGYWLPFILIALAALGIYIAPNHRGAFIGAGIGVALAMLLAAILLQVVRRAYLDGVPQDVLPPAAAASLYDTVIRYLREAIRAGFLVGLIVAAGAFLTGPSVTASTTSNSVLRSRTICRRMPS